MSDADRRPKVITRSNFWFVFGGLWFAVGALFAVIGTVVLWQHKALEARLADEGAVASGVVLSKSMSGGSNQEPKFRVEYRFKSTTGETFERTATVDGKTWDALVEDGPATVRHVRAAPRLQRLSGEEPDDLIVGSIMSVIGGLFAVSGGLILWRAAARRRFVARVLTEGPRASAEVIAVMPTNFRINRVPQWAIRYRYRDVFGNSHEGRTSPMPQDEARRWQPGDRVQVGYDSNRPQRSVWIGS